MLGVVRDPLIKHGSSFFLLRDLGFMIKTFLPDFSESVQKRDLNHRRTCL